MYEKTRGYVTKLKRALTPNDWLLQPPKKYCKPRGVNGLHAEAFCKICKTLFVKNMSRQLYCSQACSKKGKALQIRRWRRRGPVRPLKFEKVCKVCGITFKSAVNNAAMCSNACRAIERRQHDKRRWRQRKKLLGLILFVPLFAFAQDVRVIDGDTLEYNGDKIRLYGIDAPEMSQPAGDLAKGLLEMFVQSSVITKVIERDRDQYGRLIATIVVRGANAKHDRNLGTLSSLQLMSGAAWVYDQYCDDTALCAVYRQWQAMAMSGDKGLWSYEGTPIPPWTWRQR